MRGVSWVSRLSPATRLWPRDRAGIGYAPRACLLRACGSRTGRAVGLIFMGFSQPQLAPAPFYLLGCTWLVYFVRPWEPMSRPGMRRPVDERPGPWNAQRDPGEDRKKVGGERGRNREIYIHWETDLTVSWLGMLCNFVSTMEVPTTIWQTLRMHTKKPIIAPIL